MLIPRSRWHAATGAIVLAYILTDAFLIATGAAWANWFAVHIFALGALTNALFIWTEHFSVAILRRRAEKSRAQEATLLALLNLGILALITGMWISHMLLIIGSTALIGVATIGHIARLGRAIRIALPARFTIVPRIYLTSAALFLPGVACGAALATYPPGRWYVAALGAHITLNVLGWIGLPIVATLLTLWPTILRAQLPPGAERAGKRYLPLIATTPVIAALGAGIYGLGEFFSPSAVAGASVRVVSSQIIDPFEILSRIVMTGGIIGFVVLAIAIFIPLTATTWRLAHGSFSAYSVAAGVTWLMTTITVAALEVAFLGPARMLSGLSSLLLPLLGGGIAQVLMGSLGYLLPTMMGGGPKVYRVRIERIDRWATWRVGVINLSLMLFLALRMSQQVPLTTQALRAAALVCAIGNIACIIHAIMPVSPGAADNAPRPWTDSSGEVFRTVRVRAGIIAAAATVGVIVIISLVAGHLGVN